MIPGVAAAADGAASTDVKQATIEVRRGFVRKVYSILTAQLLLTVAVAAPFQRLSPQMLQNHRWLLWLSVSMSFAMIVAMTCCCQGLARQFPVNYLMLFVFTGFEGVMIGFVCASYEVQSVLIAAGVTIVIFLGLTTYACFTKRDFTGMGPYLFGALLSLCIFGLVLGILSAFGITFKFAEMAYNLVGILIFVLYVVFDTQLILGEWGGHKNQFSIDDYVFAALSLYLDIINLFLHILSLFGARK